MKAAVLYEPNTPLVIEDLHIDPPKAGEVKVRVAANGACHSDLHVMTGDMRMPLPMVLGHEGAGVVAEVGAGVTSVKEGDHVVLSFNPVCGTCYYCTQGKPHLCETRPRALGTLLDGTTRLRKNNDEIFHFAYTASFAEEAIVHESCAIKIREDIPLDRACFVGLRNHDRRGRGNQYRQRPARLIHGCYRLWRRGPECRSGLCPGRGAAGYRGRSARLETGVCQDLWRDPYHQPRPGRRLQGGYGTHRRTGRRLCLRGHQHGQDD